MVEKIEVRFPSGSDELAGWWFSSGRAGAACIVVGHGFSLTMRDGLAQYAGAFAEAGHDVLVFDHRYLGESGGEPRQRFSVADQQEDWRSAIALAQERSGAERVHLWAYSFGGGHVA
ncbi:MAG: alpha/beta fold hydrolase, partial [Actinomycetales bacterium]